MSFYHWLSTPSGIYTVIFVVAIALWAPLLGPIARWQGKRKRYFLPDEEYPEQGHCDPGFLANLLEGGKLVSTSQIAYDMRIAVAQGDQQAIKYLAKNCFLDTEAKYHFFDQLGRFDDTGIDMREIAKALASEIGSELEVMAEEGY